jgi:hypothetical protein
VGALTFAVLERPPSNALALGAETPALQGPAAGSPQASD